MLKRSILRWRTVVETPILQMCIEISLEIQGEYTRGVGGRSRRMCAVQVSPG
jgi:hypothetical protein